MKKCYQVSFVVTGFDQLEPEDVNLVVREAGDDRLDDGDLLRHEVVEDVDAIFEVDVLRFRSLLGLQDVFVDHLKSIPLCKMTRPETKLGKLFRLT